MHGKQFAVKDYSNIQAWKKFTTMIECLSFLLLRYRNYSKLVTIVKFIDNENG